MQALSLGTGMAHEFNGMSLKPSDLVSNKSKSTTTELIERYPILWDRWLHSDISEEMNLINKGSKIRDFGAKGMIFMDKKTITKGFNAINSMYIKKYGKDYNGLDKMVDAHFRDWYYKTQPTYDKELLPRAVMKHKVLRHILHKFTSAVRKNGAMVREAFARFSGSNKSTEDYTKLVKNVGYTVMVNATVSYLNTILANKMEQSKGEGMTQKEFNNMVAYGTAVNTISMFNPTLGSVARSVPYGGKWQDPMARSITLAIQSSMGFFKSLNEGKSPTKEQWIDMGTSFDMLVKGFGAKGAAITYTHAKAIADVTKMYIQEQNLYDEFEKRKIEIEKKYDDTLNNPVPEREIPVKKVEEMKQPETKKFTPVENERIESLQNRVNNIKLKKDPSDTEKVVYKQATKAINYQKSKKHRAKRPEIESLIKTYSKKEGLDIRLVRALVRKESEFTQFAVSSAGASGVMQLMPHTYRDVRKRMGKKSGEIFNARDNIQTGCNELKWCLDKAKKVTNPKGRDKWKGDTLAIALAFYNSGYDAVVKVKGVPNYKETIEYVKKVKQYYEENKRKSLTAKKN